MRSDIWVRTSTEPRRSPSCTFLAFQRKRPACWWNARVAGVGIDTASVDYGQSKDFQTHRILYSHDIYGLENVAHLDRLPAAGAVLIALPMKIKGGTGEP